MKLKNFYRSLFLLIFTFSLYANANINDKVKKLTLELRCMTCQNQSIHDSNSDFAKDIKIIVDQKFKEGFNEREIKDFLTERYGEYILFKPYFNSKNLFLWLFPFIILVVSMLILIKTLKKTSVK